MNNNDTKRLSKSLFKNETTISDNNNNDNNDIEEQKYTETGDNVDDNILIDF